MNLQERMMQDLKQALRDKDEVRKEILRLVRSGINYAEIELQRQATDEEVQQIIAREIRRRNEAIEMFHKGGREDLVAIDERQRSILEQYQPRQLPREEIEPVVQGIVAEFGATDVSQMGAVMRQAMAQLKGKANGALVNKIVREILSK